MMNSKWIPAAFGAAILITGCQSDKDKLTAPVDHPDASASQARAANVGLPASTTVTTPDSKPKKVDAGKFKTITGGLKYAVLKEGSGPEIKTHEEAHMHYTGWLTDGTQFDSSHKRGEPYPFVIDEGAVIKGWHIGGKGMKVGEVRQLVIPPALAYGPEGRDPIPPNATLIFGVELMKIAAHSH